MSDASMGSKMGRFHDYCHGGVLYGHCVISLSNVKDKIARIVTLRLCIVHL